MNINDPQSGWNIPGLRTHGRHAKHKQPESINSNRVPFLGWLPANFRNHFIASSGEFVGTFLFLFFALSGTQVANTQPTPKSVTTEYASNPALLMYISLAFGFSLAVNAWVFFRISGGLFNPAVTFGMCLVGALPWWRGLWLFIAQILGGISSAAVVSALFPGNLNSETTLAGGTSVAQGLFIEMFCTAELVFAIFMLAAEKHKGTFIAPIGIGLALFVAELTGVYYTGGSLNPARSLGPAVVNRSFPGYHWIYWLGPILGTLVAAGFYKFIKALEYETANPGQDMDEKEAHTFNPDGVDETHKPFDYGDPENGMTSQTAVNGPNTAAARAQVLKESGPAMQSPNAQYAGLNAGGMHANERNPHVAGTMATPSEKVLSGTT